MASVSICAYRCNFKRLADIDTFCASAIILNESKFCQLFFNAEHALITQRGERCFAAHRKDNEIRDQQSSDTSIALDANTDVQQEADKPAVKWRYLFGFLAWTVLNAIVIALCAGASVLTIKRIK